MKVMHSTHSLDIGNVQLIKTVLNVIFEVFKMIKKLLIICQMTRSKQQRAQ